MSTNDSIYQKQIIDEQRFRDLTEATSDWVWEVDSNGIYVYSSPVVQDVLGYSVNEVIGKRPFDFMVAHEAKRVSTLFKSILASKEMIAIVDTSYTFRAVNYSHNDRMHLLFTEYWLLITLPGHHLLSLWH